MTPRRIEGVEGASWMLDYSRSLDRADESGFDVALDELDEVIEDRLLQTQRREEALGLVHRVFVERFSGSDAVSALEEPGTVRREGRDFVEVFHGTAFSRWRSLP
jgi:hypothetical protein